MVVYSGIIGIIFATISLWGIQWDKKHSNFMSMEQTGCIKGLCALEVFLCHVYAYFPQGYTMRVFNAIAYIPVAIFFMYTGYGLVYSAERNTGYLKGFLKKRFIRLYIPLWIALLLAIVVRFMFGYERTYGFRTILCDIIGLNAIWFFKIIVIYYLAFWLVWSFAPPKYRHYVMIAIVVIQSVCCALLKTDKSYYTSSFGFIIGMFLAMDDNFDRLNKIIEWVKAHKALIFITVGFVGTGIVGAYYVFHDNVLVGHLLLRNLIGIGIVCFFVFCNYQITLGNIISKILGSYSYELFLVHPVILICVKSSISDTLLPQWLQVLVACAVTAVCASLVKYVNNTIVKHALKG